MKTDVQLWDQQQHELREAHFRNNPAAREQFNKMCSDYLRENPPRAKLTISSAAIRREELPF